MSKKLKPAQEPPRSIALSWGDPAGIGPEIILKSFNSLPKKLRNRLTVFGKLSYFKILNRKFKSGVNILEAHGSKPGDDGLRVEDAVSLKFSHSDFGKTDKRFGKAAMRSVEKAMDAVTAGRFGALVTAPISKESVNRAGYRVAGHTEFLSERMGGVDVAMLLSSKKLKVVVATRHVALNDVPKMLNAKKLTGLIKLVNTGLGKLGVRRPRIAVCGLNPHASDGGLFGDEEKNVIKPAVNAALKAGIDVAGPFSADTMFTPQALNRYDVAIAMYHDQGLIPVKALSFGKTVNITLGLPFLRLSVDHGTAFDIAGKNRADPKAMIYAIKTADRILNRKFSG